jgi:hypothetical protein
MMIDALRLIGRTSIARFDLAQSIVATTPDDARDAKTTALAKIADVRSHLELSVTVIDAIDRRIALRPTPPPPVTLQDLVRSGRRRLAEERQRGSRRWVEERTVAVNRLQTVLERA